MPQDSKRKRHLRRVRRDRSLAYRMVNQLLAERELSRKIILGMAGEIEKQKVELDHSNEEQQGSDV